MSRSRASDVRIVPEIQRDNGQANTFIFSDRRSSAGVPSPDDVSNTESSLQLFPQTFERVARARLARGEIEDGVIQLTML
jgi:hypothetical protein